MREIFAKYDVTDISPNSFGQRAQNLFSQGVISQKDLPNLTALRNSMQASGVGPDESVNLLDFARQQTVGANAASGQTAAALQQMSLLAKFAAGHRQADLLGVSTMA